LTKEQIRGRLSSRYRPTVADNLVHVSHFSPASLKRALARAGFIDVQIQPGAPELPPGGGVRGLAGRISRLSLHHLARLMPGGVHTPITFNLQAYARRP
jgi:hypothetical protein